MCLIPTQKKKGIIILKKILKEAGMITRTKQKKRLLDVKRQCQQHSLPIFERMTVDLDYTVFDKGFCSDQFIVACIVDNINYSSSTGDT